MLPNLKKLRLRNHLSQQKVGEAVGLSQQAINRYENQDVEPDIATLSCLADFFHTSVDYLIGHHAAENEALFSCPLSPQEVDMVTKYRLLKAAQQEAVRGVIDSYQ